MSRRQQYDPLQTRENILGHARTLFSQKGYTSTTINEICAAAGISKGAIYHHFRNKEELFVSLAEYSFAKAWEDWDACTSSYTSVLDKLYAYGDYFVDTLERPLTKAGEDFIASAGLESPAGQKFYGIVTGYTDRFERLIAEGIASGEFIPDNPKELAFIVLSYYSGLSDSHRFLDKPAMKLLFRKATHLLLEGFRNRNHEEELK